MRLQDIGFYTLSDERALSASAASPLQRCELVLTENCNFRCTYCRGITNPTASGAIPLALAKSWVKYWTSQGLKNIRFTGGEPLLYKGLLELVEMCRERGVERIAISSNGSLPLDRYLELLDAGVNDLSISLDAGCSLAGEIMSGGRKAWARVVENIQELSARTYITLGMVFTEDNVDDCVEHVIFADSLGAADIRVIPSAQYNRALLRLADLDQRILQKYPILRYRINNIQKGLSVRGMGPDDCRKCWLALDDMACAQGYHFPCIIHLREGGDPVGKLGFDVRAQRANWIDQHDSFNDPICRNNCLDVCVA